MVVGKHLTSLCKTPSEDALRAVLICQDNCLAVGAHHLSPAPLPAVVLLLVLNDHVAQLEALGGSVAQVGGSVLGVGLACRQVGEAG